MKYLVVGMCGSWAGQRNPQGENNEKQITAKNTRQRVFLHLLVRNNTWAGLWPDPSNLPAAHGNSKPARIEAVSHGPGRAAP